MSSEISAKFRAKMHELASFGGDLTLDSINVVKTDAGKSRTLWSDGGIVESVIIPPLPGEAEEDGKKRTNDGVRLFAVRMRDELSVLFYR